MKLTIPVEDGRYTLQENGEQYEQLWRFHNRDEVKSHLSRLDMSEAQLAELWAGEEVELAEGLTWPVSSSPERAHPAVAHPAALETPPTQQRAGPQR